MSRYIDVDKYRKDLLSAYDDVSMEFEVLDRQPLVQVISLDKVKQARVEMESLSKTLQGNTAKHSPKGLTWQNLGVNMCLEILDKLIEEVEDESNEDN